MRDLQGMIAALGSRLSGAKIVRGREIDGSVAPGGALKLAQALHADHGAELRPIRQAVERVPAGPLAATLGALPAFEPVWGMVEGWRGAISHWVMADAAGLLYRVKIMDPSFLKWRPLSYALLKNILPGFPLCTKSFNQSSSGNDL